MRAGIAAGARLEPRRLRLELLGEAGEEFEQLALVQSAREAMTELRLPPQMQEIGRADGGRSSKEGVLRGVPAGFPPDAALLGVSQHLVPCVKYNANILCYFWLKSA
ncbi:MAG TPA: hypothetical protein VFA50_18105 [Stellaceae bacterium]|nr:hypothetical protein [Stellaceae bacterium]